MCIFLIVKWNIDDEGEGGYYGLKEYYEQRPGDRKNMVCIIRMRYGQGEPW